MARWSDRSITRLFVKCSADQLRFVVRRPHGGTILRCRENERHRYHLAWQERVIVPGRQERIDWNHVIARRRKAVRRGEARIGAGKRGRGTRKVEQHHGERAGDRRDSVGDGQRLVPKVGSP